MAFTYDPTTARGRVRLLLGDTDVATAAHQIFSDDEIDAFLSIEENEIYAAAGAGCESLAVAASHSAIIQKAGSILSLDRSKIPEHYRMLAVKYRERAVEGAPTEEVDSFDYDVTEFGVDESEYVGDVVS